ncbi:EF-hand domain-containing family member C2 [Amphibalanus amphitrite]|uniref:EF-hand domain-containing family member C2 n=1 Tax=Amphibalanus amphitrite TaxID=1232801 RepID=A0A6A4V1U3_AMPAM|nr:EF-hand domain-containing family member C2 [Amphibalanus amphitrite]
MSLPFLPGYSEIGKEIGSRDLPRPGWTKRIPRHSFYPRTAGPGLPAWVAFDKQVLRFRGYYTDRVENSQLERGRIRAVKIHFYLEDDTIEVIESKWKNSQLPQGTLLHRHRVPLPEPDDCEFYTIEHLNVGRDLPLYGTIYHITSCDTFTRNFLSKLGVRVNPDSCIPSDPYMEQRNDQLKALPRPGVECPRTVLNTFGDIYGKGMGRHFIFDNLNNNYHPSDFYQ